MSRLEDWLLETFPNQLDDNHRWSWLMQANDEDGHNKNILFLHLCNDKYVTSWIDITSGERHTLVSEDPLHVEASILCPICGDHGFIRDGKWVKA